MSFDDFMNDNIVIRKQNGKLIEGLKASVQSKKIFLQRSDVLIEPGDLVERRSSNGAVETFEVIDPGFFEDFHGIKAHYQMSVRKLGLPEANEKVSNITYHVTGNNARINNNSIDKSTNTVSLGTDLMGYVDSLRKEIEHLTDVKQKKESLDIIDAVESHLSSPKASKTVVSALLKALPHIGSVAKLGSAIISALN